MIMNYDIIGTLLYLYTILSLNSSYYNAKYTLIHKIIFIGVWPYISFIKKK